MGQLLTSDLIIPLNNMSDGDDSWARNLHFEDSIDILTDHNIETATIVWDINWTDTFGRTEDIHGNEYHEQYFHMNNIEEDMTFVEFMQMEDFIKEQEGEDN
jgi:hypothetical protein